MLPLSSHKQTEPWGEALREKEQRERLRESLRNKQQEQLKQQVREQQQQQFRDLQLLYMDQQYFRNQQLQQHQQQRESFIHERMDSFGRESLREPYPVIRYIYCQQLVFLYKIIQIIFDKQKQN